MVVCCFPADITPEEIFNMFFGGFGGASMSGGEKVVLVVQVSGNGMVIFKSIISICNVYPLINFSKGNGMVIFKSIISICNIYPLRNFSKAWFD